MNPKHSDEAPGSGTAPVGELTVSDNRAAIDGWVADEQLNDTCVFRDPLREAESRNDLAAIKLASGRRTVRLL